MPESVTLEITAAELKAKDRWGGNLIESVRPMNTKMEVKLANGRTLRPYKTDEARIVREVPTKQDELDKASLALQVAVDEAIRYAHKVVDEGQDPSKELLATAPNLKYQLEWHTEDILVALHKVELMTTLLDRLDKIERGDEEAKCLTGFLTYVKQRLVDWYPSRSTSPMANLSNECYRTALKNIVSDYNFIGIEYWAKKVVELEAEVK